ncbi:MAG: undecaprenyl/decaprenyl-phosphate alpha-N-acetylglucosaminyl 1-phosphate transferase [Prevotellaceae bacterium]|jgi:UDP-N-acetylmuramyl pentapeptide phosphotransferase/UDP-N-acetylglucosamine-1-phosphate transferase|nr:undecaprenyl/decaprenyl-phosphate alpha-N-acetylglucosaminyl 1-phosphate transferase [Prevotellaceae bacterium]
MANLVSILTQHAYLSILITFIAGLITMPFVIRIARKHNLVVKPNKRTSHQGAIPNIGGLNIFISLLLIYVWLIADAFSIYQLIGFCFIFLVGFIDDMVDLTPFWKIIGESGAALFLIVFADVRISHLHGLFGIEELPLWWSYLISYTVFFAIINSFNLIDGVDGLASGLGIVSSLFFAIYFTLVGEALMALLCFATIGALAIFFIYNVFGKSERKIFMGDSGALLTGYLLVCFVFLFLEKNAYHTVDSSYQMAAAPVVAICVLFVPLFDTVRIVLTRLKQGRSPIKPDKNHIHHLLLRTGLKHRQVTLVLLSVSLVFIVFGIVGRNWNMWLLLTVVFGCGSALTVGLWRILDHHAYKNMPPANNSSK